MYGENYMRGHLLGRCHLSQSIPLSLVTYLSLRFMKADDKLFQASEFCTNKQKHKVFTQLDTYTLLTLTYEVKISSRVHKSHLHAYIP